jgi:uncharacterized protein (TIGR00251 family)
MKASRKKQPDSPSGSETQQIALQSHSHGCVMTVRAMPGARREGIVGRHGPALKVAVTAAAQKGKANKALIDVLTKQLGLKRSALELVAGQTSPNKKVLVHGVNCSALRARLDRILTGNAMP